MQKELVEALEYISIAIFISWTCWIQAIKSSKTALEIAQGKKKKDDDTKEGQSVSTMSPIANLMRFLAGTGPIGAALLLSFLDKECGISGIKSMFCGVYVYHGAWEPLLIGGIILPVAATVLTWFLVPFCRPINTKFTFSLLIGGFIFSMVIIPMEEIGWRWYLYPRLNEILLYYLPHLMSGSLRLLVCNSIVMGCVWALWHAPLYYLSAPHLMPTNKRSLVHVIPAVISYAAGLIVVSVIQALILRADPLSLLGPLVTHSALNAAVGAAIGLEPNSQFGRWWWGYAVVLASLTASCVFFGVL